MPDNKPVESPTMGTPEKDAQQTPGLSQEDLNELLSTLEAHNVTDTKSLDGKLKASQEAGQLANLLGEVRGEVNLLRQENEALRATALRTPAPNYNQDYGETMDNLHPGTQVDFEVMLENAVEKVIGKQQRKTQQAQQQRLQSYEKASKHPMFATIKPILDQRLKDDPTLAMQLNAGKVDYHELYRDTVDEYNANLLARTHSTIKTLSGQDGTVTPDTQPPHMESGTPSPVNTQNLVTEGQQEPNEKGEIMKKAQEKVNTPGAQSGYLTENEEVDLVHGLLGDLPV